MLKKRRLNVKVTFIIFSVRSGPIAQDTWLIDVYSALSDKSSVRKIVVPVRFPSSINKAVHYDGDEGDGEGKLHRALRRGAVLSRPFERRTHLHSIYPGPAALNEYDPFAVDNYRGQIDDGHYTNYARFEDEVWLSPSGCDRHHLTLFVVISLRIADSPSRLFCVGSPMQPNAIG